MELIKQRPITQRSNVERRQPTAEDKFVEAIRALLQREETPATRGALRILIRDFYFEIWRGGMI